ncbi:hypothetical protein BC828DRAFT_380152 [Blastocladiella britannica]|nr:hypothetical protein BC828DRAFT_380152 [Blastocladiella britannica]
MSALGADADADAAPTERSPLLTTTTPLVITDERNTDSPWPSSTASSVAPNPSSREPLGLALMAGSALFFPAMTVLVKLAGGLGFPIYEIVVVRSLIQAFLAVLACWLMGLHPLGSNDRSTRWMLVTRGLTGALGLGSYFYAVIHMDLGEATVLFFTGPAITAVLAHWYLKEPLTRMDLLASSACLVGVVLVARPAVLFGSGSTYQVLLPDPAADDDPTDWTGRPLAVAAALFAALMSAVSLIIVREMGRAAHAMVQVTYHGGMAALAYGIAMAVFETGTSSTSATHLPARWPVGLVEWATLTGIGLTAFMGQLMLNWGLQYVGAGEGAVMRNLDVVFAFVFGATLFHESIHVPSLIGAALIVGTAGLSGLVKVRRTRALRRAVASDA